MVKPNKEKQQTLEATLGRPRVRPATKTRKAKTQSKATSSSPAKSSPRAPPSSFMHSSQVGGSAQKRRAVLSKDSSSEPSDEEREVELPVRKPSRGKARRASSSSAASSQAESSEAQEESGDDEADDKPHVTPMPRRKRRMVLDDSDEDDKDSQPLASSPAKRRRLVRRNAASSLAKDGKIGADEDGEDEPAPCSARTEPAKRRPLTRKEKARELRRRKRAGETIDVDYEQPSSEEEPAKPMYDPDEDHPALDKFEDDEEGVLQPQESVEQDVQRTAKAKGKKKQKAADDNDDPDSDESIDDFVVDDSDVPLGVPEDALLDIPLEFTAHSHKPLKEHFRDAIEWLVQFKINPGFDKTNAMYRMAWRKLDDEVRGLAQSKFASSAWKPEFHMALRARPYLHNPEAPKVDAFDAPKCAACGRSGHPAKHVITFSGTPYYKDGTKLDRLLQPVEISGDSESESESESYDEDEDGNPIPKATKAWPVGVVCNSNAETAHSLMHWKHALLDWVDVRLHEDGYMAPAKLAERERMGPKKKDKLVDKILERWAEGGVFKDLWQNFKETIETARNKPTTGRYR